MAGELDKINAIFRFQDEKKGAKTEGQEKFYMDILEMMKDL